ncbi:MAG: CRISPR-associated endonuclease Cas2, partial [Anaerolineae bacterium]|nr:CRISPR-associated endonuclease Cas2 [Anaerolineae bacterium]
HHRQGTRPPAKQTRKVLNAEKDSVRFYPLCAACLKQVETVGSDLPKEPKAFIT